MSLGRARTFDKQSIPSERLTPGDRGELKQAAIEGAPVSYPVTSVQSFRDFAGLLQEPETQAAGIRSMLSIPRDQWPGEDAARLAPEVLALAAATHPQLRSTSAFEWTVELGQELANALHEDEADRPAQLPVRSRAGGCSHPQRARKDAVRQAGVLGRRRQTGSHRVRESPT